MEFSGYLTGNRAADADRDKDGEAYYCCCYLVCLKPAMDFISPFFRVQHFNQNILAVAVRCSNDICFLVVARNLLFRGSTQCALTRWKHYCLFSREKGCGGDVFLVLNILVVLS